jgi:uncharacterized protein YjiS (DUF1127 family)
MTAVPPIAADRSLRSNSEESHSLLGRWSRPFAGALRALSRGMAERRLRNKLADMDEAPLRDIGIAEDEIYRIGARERFMPRAWVERADLRRRPSRHDRKAAPPPGRGGPDPS